MENTNANEKIKQIFEMEAISARENYFNDEIAEVK